MEKQAQEKSGITAKAIRYPIATLTLTSLVIVLGFFFLDRLAVDLLPSITYPQITVTTNYPGTAPEVMEQQVTRVLESRLAATENVIAIESRASEGRTNVNLYFDYGTDIDLALQDAARNLELARTQLPVGVTPPRIYKRDPSQMAIFEAGFTSSIRSPIEVRDWLENVLVPQVQAVRGVGGGEVAGGQIREIQVILDQYLLENYGLSITEIEALLRNENIDIAAGQVTSSSFDVMAKTDGRFRGAEDVANLVVQIPGTSNHIRLGELAEVVDTFQDQRLFVRLNSEPATRLSITKLPDANTVAVIDRLKRELDRLQRSGFIPEDVIFSITRDQSFFINSSIRAVSSAAVLGGFLAMIIVVLFLGSLRKALIIGITIPIALFIAFTLMAFGGLTLNIMSLGGLALGVGLLLDNGIVMLENIYRHKEDYKKNGKNAAIDGSNEVTSAVIASTLTNLAAVLPFLLIPGLAAMLFQDLIITISLAIIASLAAAITLVPTLAALFSRIETKSGFNESKLIKEFNKIIDLLRGQYLRLARLLFQRDLTVISLSIILFIGSFFVLSRLGTEFLPQVDDGSVFAGIRLPPGTPPDVTYNYALTLEDTIREMPHIENVFGLVGGHLGGGILNERPGTARFSIQLTPAVSRPGMSGGQWVQELQEKLDQLEIPGARLVTRPPRIPGIRISTAGTAVSIGIVGQDIELLDRVGRTLLLELEGIPGLVDLDMSRSDRSPLLNININRERAADFGLNISEIGTAVRTAVHGSVPTRFSSGSRDYDIRLLLPRDEVRDPDDLSNLILFRRGTDSIRLGDVATFDLTDGPAHIERENQVRILRLGGDVNTAVSDIGAVNNAIRERISELSLPDEVNLIFGGEEEVIRETRQALTTVIFLALFLVFVVLAVQYEKLTNPVVILVSSPLALVGVSLALWSTGVLLSAPALLGIVLLMGIVVNNAILLIEYIEIGRQEQGLVPLEAALDAARVRFRPILMTTLTTIFGMVPLALGLGSGSELMQPLAIVVIGGLFVSMALTLIVIPSFYLLVARLLERFNLAPN